LADPMKTSDKVRRIRCGTKKCAGFVDAQLSEVAKSVDGNWQFECSICKFWSLASDTGQVKATSKERFDLDRLPTALRLSPFVTRVPPGGV
jgi:hypothetical protein